MTKKPICAICNKEMLCSYASGLHIIECRNCGWSFQTFEPTLDKALAAFRLATRADIKQGIQWISAKDRLPTLEDGIKFDDGTVDVLALFEDNYIGRCNYYPKTNKWNNVTMKPTHFAFLNLPRRKNDRSPRS